MILTGMRFWFLSRLLRRWTRRKTLQFELFPDTQLVKKCDEMDDKMNDKMKTYHDHLVLKNRVRTA